MCVDMGPGCRGNFENIEIEDWNMRVGDRVEEGFREDGLMRINDHNRIQDFG